ncbi:MAG: AMP-binding protein [Ruminiclostridium sp.]
MSKMQISPYSDKKRTSKFDLSINIVQRGSSQHISIEYCTKLFKRETVEKYGEHYIQILKKIMDNKNILISQIDLLSDEEKNHILNDFNNTQMDYPSHKTIQQLFEEQVERTPERIAVSFVDYKLTYDEFNRKANHVANYLRSVGVHEESIVGIMVNRSAEILVGIMGILKSGAAYLPIDPKYPGDRISYMLQESDSQILITEDGLKDSVEFGGKIIDIYNVIESFDMNENPEKLSKPQNLAYVLYTSGSTGQPKGVMIENRQVCNFIHSMIRETKMDSYRNILCITTVCFDIFGLETLLPLVNGLEVIIADSDTSIDAEKLGRLIKERNIEVIQYTPSRLNILLDSMEFQDAMQNVKIVLVGGEEVPSSLYKKWNRNKETKIFNVYGPTETTIWSTIQELEDEDNINIGHPIGNTQVYILNDNKIVPIGAEGELYIGGDGVSLRP